MSNDLETKIEELWDNKKTENFTNKLVKDLFLRP